jgi:hypothetical protein
MSPDDTQPCCPPVVELCPEDLEDEDAPWAGFADEIRGLEEKR